MIKRATLEEELKKCPELKMEYIQSLKDWLKRQPHLPQVDDDMILVMFLRSCDFSIEKSKVTIDNYFTFRTHVKEMSLGRTMKNADTKTATELIETVTLKQLDPEGNLVIINRLRNTDPSNFNMGVGLKVNTWLMESYMVEKGSTNGVIVVLDQKGFGLGHLARIPIMTAKRLLFYVQECANIQVRGIHIINANQYIEKILMFFKPFMSKHLISLMQVHVEGSFDSFYKYVPKEILPKEYGGPCGSMPELQSEILKDSERFDDYFEKLDLLQVEESKRAEKSASQDTLFGVEGSFKKLDID